MLDFILAIVAYVGLAVLIVVGIFFNRRFLFTLFLIKPFIDMTVNINIINEINALEISGIFIFLIFIIKYLNKPVFYPTTNEVLIWIFLGLQILTFFLNISTDSRAFIDSIKTYPRLIGSYLLYFIAAREIMENYQQRTKLVKAIWITSLIAGIITIIVFVFGLSNFDTTRGVVRYNGLYNDPGTPSYLSVICLLFCNLYFSISAKEPNDFLKFLRVITLVVTAIILVITMTKSALIMFLVYIIMWYGIFEKRLFLIIPALAISIYISFSLSEDLNTRFETELNYIDSGGDADVAKSMGTGRVNRWENLINMYFQEFPLYKQVLGSSRNFIAHNQYLAYLLQVGALGLSVFLIFIIRFLTRLTKIYYRTRNPSIFAALTLLVMYVTYAFTGHPFDYTTLLWYLMILLSMVNVYDSIREKKERNKNLERIQFNQLAGQKIN